MKAKKIYEKFEENSDPIQDMGIGPIAQRKFKTEEEFIKWMCETAIPKILGGWPIDMVPPGERDNYIRTKYYEKILQYFADNNINFNIGEKTGQLVPRDPFVYNWVKKIKKYHYGDENYRPVIKESFVEESDPIQDLGIGESAIFIEKVKTFIQLVNDDISKNPDFNFKSGDVLRKVNCWKWGLFMNFNYIYYPDIQQYKKQAEKFIKEVELDHYFSESFVDVGSSNTINVIFLCKPEYYKLFQNLSTKIFIKESLNEGFEEDSDPIDDMGIGISTFINHWDKKIKELDVENFEKKDVYTTAQYYNRLIYEVYLLIPRIDVKPHILISTPKISAFYKNRKRVDEKSYILNILKTLNLTPFLEEKVYKDKSGWYRDSTNWWRIYIKPKYVKNFKNSTYYKEITYNKHM